MGIFVSHGGDTLLSVSRRTAVSPDLLAEANGLFKNERLAMGQALFIPDRAQEPRRIELNAVSVRAAAWQLPRLTYFCPFAWRLGEGGTLIPHDDTAAVRAALSGTAVPILTVANIGSDGCFSAKLAHSVLCDSRLQTDFIENTLAAVSSRGYMGVNLFFEYLYPFDREGFTALAERISEALHSRGLYFFCSLAPRSGEDEAEPLSAAQDNAVFGRLCDRVILLSYDWGCALTPPQAPSPLPKMREALGLAVSQIPRGKLLMGLSHGGYLWQLPYSELQAAEPVSPRCAERLAASVGAEIRYDAVSGAAHFRFSTPDGIRRELWFEDARSISEKLALVREFGIRGISLISPCRSDAALFAMLSSGFYSEKLI